MNALFLLVPFRGYDTKLVINFFWLHISTILGPSCCHPPVVQVENIHKSFGDNHVLRNFSMTLERRENLAILGKLGSGKSVLIKCIINLIAADKARIVVLDRLIQNMEQDDLDMLRAKVGFLFQSNALSQLGSKASYFHKFSGVEVPLRLSIDDFCGISEL